MRCRLYHIFVRGEEGSGAMDASKVTASPLVVSSKFRFIWLEISLIRERNRAEIYIASVATKLTAQDGEQG